ncbi:hypothetical protein BX616_008848 [Lobosporangium transversale]|nr:hypothetical protein BX616_008848 [Lobosporangium transversale]
MNSPSTAHHRAFDEHSRLQSKPQTLDDIYGEPENFLEIEVRNPQNHGSYYVSIDFNHEIVGCFLSDKTLKAGKAWLEPEASRKL